MNEIIFYVWMGSFVHKLMIALICAIVSFSAVAGLKAIIANDMGEKAVGIKKYLIALFVCCVGFVFTPGPEVFYMLAATKAGRAAENTGLGAKAIKAIDAVLDGIIEKHGSKQ